MVVAVGAVALDCHGNVACATSSGGISIQSAGRISDCAIAGSGGFADNSSGVENKIVHLHSGLYNSLNGSNVILIITF